MKNGLIHKKSHTVRASQTIIILFLFISIFGQLPKLSQKKFAQYAT